jgi:hypothetical protein
LRQGEHLLWTGQPRQGRAVRGAVDVVAVVFGLVFGVVVWRSVSLFGGLSTIDYLLFCSPVAFFVGHALLVRWVLDPRRRARTHYAVTDQRILTITPRRTASVELGDLVSVTAWVNGVGLITGGAAPPGIIEPMIAKRLSAGLPHGSGNIYFGVRRTDGGWFAPKSPPMFEMIEAAPEVMEIITRARRGEDAKLST